MMRLVYTLLAVGLSSAVLAQTPLKRLYLGNDTHTDIMYNGTEEEWAKMTLDMADFYLGQCEHTLKHFPSEERARWNFDTGWALYQLEKRKPVTYLQRILAQLKNGQMSVPYNFTLPLYGCSTPEAVLRSFYYSGYLERKYGLDLDLAVCQENATIPLGLASLWAGSGAKYSWKGVCNCATKTKTIGTRDHEIYWYTGLDGQRILMKWYSNYGWNAELGGYGEMLEPTRAIIQMDTLCGSKRYPYRIAAAFGKGWDNMHNYSFDAQWGLKPRTLPGTKVMLSNESDFFKDFEKEYGDKLPSQTVAYGNEWDNLPACLAEVSGQVRRSVEKLRAAEAMAAVVGMKQPGTFASLDPLKADFMYSLSMYSAHSWTVDGPIKRHDFATWARQLQAKITRYVDTLHTVAAQQLGQQLAVAGSQKAFFVFNPLNWPRTELADVPYAGPDVPSIVDLTTRQRVPTQRIERDGQTYLRILATNVPSVGYKLYGIGPGGKAAAGGKLSFSQNIITTPFARLTLSPGGGITSLIETKTGREWATPDKPLNSLDSGYVAAGTLTLVHAGPHSLQVRCEGPKPLKHSSLITAYAHTPRIDIQNEVRQNFGDPLHWSFRFNVPQPELWHEEVGAVIKAKTVKEGGHYADRMARYDYLTYNHFADMGNATGGITLSNLDCLFLKLGNSTPDRLDSDSPEVKVLIGGQIDKDKNLGIRMQDGDSLFRQHLALIPRAGRFDQTAAMKAAMSHQNPLVVGMVSGSGEASALQRSFLTTTDSNVLLWALKPGEEGGTTARLWHLGTQPTAPLLNWGAPIRKATEATHVETDIAPIVPQANALPTQFRQHQLKTYRVWF
jgi:alpha-mannosidase